MRPTRLVLPLVLIATCVVLGPAVFSKSRTSGDAPAEALAGFDLKTNGFVDQATYDSGRDRFAAVRGINDGVGPVYNASSCGECHGNPVVGGSSQILVVRAGRLEGSDFVEHPGGSLIQSRAIDPDIQEQIEDGYDKRTFRSSTSLLGLGYVEAIADETLLAIAARQPMQTNGRVRGQAIQVPILEAPGMTRVGRFGWKSQHASLFSFAGDALLNEMGITTPLFPVENTSNGKSIDNYDLLPDPDEGTNDDLDAIARFIRATKAPSRHSVLSWRIDALAGDELFENIGCGVCHVAAIDTAPPGTVLNGGTFVVSDALGSKRIRPWSDFLLHDIGTGDGIGDAAHPETRNKIRTTPLWGLRTRNRLMHDGASLTIEDAILRHAGEARQSTRKYRRLSAEQRDQILTFLRSL